MSTEPEPQYRIEWKFIAGFLVPIKHLIPKDNTDAITTTVTDPSTDPGGSPNTGKQ